MKKFLTYFFVFLGVVFFVLIIIGGYFYVTDPLNLKPIIFGNEKLEIHEDDTDRNPLLSESQERALMSIGIDPAQLPTEVTPEQEACAEAKLGKERVAEIKAGSTPTPAEYFRAKECM